MSDSSNISIKIDPQGTRYKSISNLEWDNIPYFAILTGRNGSGKSQLLELLAYKISQTTHHQISPSIKVKIEGDQYSSDEVTFISNSHSYSYGITLEVAHIQNAKRQLWDQFRQHHHQGDLRQHAKRQRLVKLIGKDISSATFEEFEKLLPDDYVFMLENEDMVTGLAHIFLGYRFRSAELREQGRSEAEILKELGPTPWDTVNDTLRIAGFPYRVISPLKGKLLDKYEFRLVEEATELSIQPNDLSSGEKVILQLILWLYSSRNYGRFPRLMLLDEPDAHLHPSMTQQFMDVISEVLVKKFKTRVIMSTHSPSTVALAPENSIFELSRKSTRIVPSRSKADTIGLLTAGLVTVSPATRFVLVEDTDDVNFYNAVVAVLSNSGSSRDKMALDPAPTIVFLPSSTGRNGGGGKNMVSHWVQKLDKSPLDQMFKGVIDLDSGNSETDRVKVIGRYSVENYFLDPLVVFGLLIELNLAPNLPNISISVGDEHLIRNLDDTALQSVVDHVTNAAEAKFPAKPDSSKVPVQFTNGKKIQYPTWMLKHRGHDLLPIFQRTFGPKNITPPNLIRSFQRVRMVPVELANLLHSIQKGI